MAVPEPAGGALDLSEDLNLKFAEALDRELKAMKRYLKLRIAWLKICHLPFQAIRNVRLLGLQVLLYLVQFMPARLVVSLAHLAAHLGRMVRFRRRVDQSADRSSDVQ